MPSPHIRVISRISSTLFLICCVFASPDEANAQGNPIRLLGPAIRRGGEPPLRFSFRGNDVLKVEYESSQALFDTNSGMVILSSDSGQNLGVDYDPLTGTVIGVGALGYLEFYRLQNETLESIAQTTIDAHQNIRFSKDGKRILLGEKILVMLDAETKETLWSVEVEGNPGSLPLKWNEDSGVVEVSEFGLPFRIQLLSDMNGDPLYSYGTSTTGYPGEVMGSAMSVFSDTSGSSILIDHHSLTETFFTHTPTEFVDQLRVLNDGSTIMGTSVNNIYSATRSRFFMRNLMDDTPVNWIDSIRANQGFTDRVTGFAMSDDESILLLGTENGRLERWDYGSRQYEGLEVILNGAIRKITLYGNNTRCLIETFDEGLTLWNLNSSSAISSRDYALDAVLSDDGSLIAFETTTGPIEVVDINTGLTKSTFPAAGQVAMSARFVGDGSQYQIIYRDGSVVTYGTESDLETSRTQYDWSFRQTAFKYDNSPYLVGLGGNKTYVVDLSDGTILHELDVTATNSLTSDYIKLSEDAKTLMIRALKEGENPTFQFIDLSLEKLLVEVKGSTSRIDLSLDGSSALIWQRRGSVEDTVSVDINGNQYILPGEVNNLFRLILVDLKTGDYRQSPSTTFPRSTPDLEFSSDGNNVYVQRGLQLYTLDVSTWNASDIPGIPGDNPNDPIKLLRVPQGKDLLVYRNLGTITIIDPETGAKFGSINDSAAAVVISPNGQDVLSLYNGVYKRHEFREGKFIPARFVPEGRYTDTWNLMFNSREGSFYKLQSSWDLQTWESFDNTPMGTGEPLQEYFMRLYPPTKIFGRVIEFSSPESAE